jgi:hypothetical protein
MKKLIILLLLLLPVTALSDSLHFVSSDNTDWRDFKMYENDDHLNRGGNADLSLVTAGIGTNRLSGFCFTNWDTVQVLITDSVVSDSLIYWLYCNTLTTNPSSVSIYQALKPGYLYEGTADGTAQVGSNDNICWYHATGGTDSNWVKTCADSANDAATWNRTDGTGADRKATASATVSVTATGSFYRFAITGADADSIQYGLKTHYGYIVKTTANAPLVFSSSENATAGQRPIVSWFYHTVSSSPPVTRNRLVPFLRSHGDLE